MNCQKFYFLKECNFQVLINNQYILVNCCLIICWQFRFCNTNPGGSLVLHAGVSYLLTCNNNTSIMGDYFGGVPERPKGSDCKSDGSAFEGSNPSPSTSRKMGPAWHWRFPGVTAGGGSSMVEPQPSKLMTRVRFPFAAPAAVKAVNCPCSSVAEHSLGKGEVACSIHAMGTRNICTGKRAVLR